MNARVAPVVNLATGPRSSIPDRLAAAREQTRLDGLDQYDVMDTPPEETFDSITRLARQVFGMPMAAITFIDGHREWFKSRDGFSETQLPRHASLGESVLASGEPLVILDGAEDDHWRDHPCIAGSPHIRFYAATPLLNPAGLIVGTLGVFDSAPRDFGPAELGLLSDLARMTVTVLELRLRTMLDPLTGLMSRPAFRAEADRMALLARRHRQELSCVMVGIDDFAGILRRDGAAASDDLVQRLAERLQNAIRASDVVGRVGPATFACLLPFTSGAGAREAAERLLLATADIGCPQAGGRLPANIGVATYDPRQRDASGLLEEAEAGLLHARRHGRGRIFAWPRNASVGLHMRRRVFSAGRVETAAGTQPCTVRSLSARYAELDVLDAAALPERLTLHVPTEAWHRLGRITAREADRIEVEFD